ncbi:MAG: sterol-binding protein [Candidatus Dadabacteria bacterium]
MVKYDSYKRRQIEKMATPKEIFAKIERKISAKPDESSQINAVYKFVLNGPNGGTWIVDLRKGTLGVRENDSEAHCTITVSDENFVKIATKQMRADVAFMTGKLKLSGDMGVAMKLGKLFEE